MELKKYATGDDVITQGKISEQDFYQFLKEFNDIEESEGDGYVKGDNSDPKNPVKPSGAKITKLQDKLDEWFDGAIDIRNFNNAAYSESLAANNRASFLCKDGKPLD